MKKILFLIILSIFIYSNSKSAIFDKIFLAVDNNLDNSALDKNISLIRVKSRGSLDAIRNLKDNKANIALVRGDVLGIKKNGILGLEPYTNYGIICSPNKSILYLVSKVDINSINDFRNKKISTGVMTNLAQIYLNNVLKNSGLEFDISFNALNLNSSIRALKKGTIDIILMFAPKYALYKFNKSGLVIKSLPDDFFKNLTFRRGLKSFSYRIKNRKIRTLAVPNFFIAPVKTIDKNISSKIEQIVKRFECYKHIPHINSFYGVLHPLVKDIINSINQKEKEPPKKENFKNRPIKFLFKRKVILDNEVSYVYNIENRVSSDVNISFWEFRTNSFDNMPIKPRHLISIFPKGVMNFKGKSKKIVTFTYKNPFLYKISPREIEVVYKNLSKESNNSVLSLYLTIGDNE